MRLDFHGLHMKAREVCTHRGQKPRLFKGDAMVDVKDCVFSHHRLLRLLQTSTAPVYTNAGADAMPMYIWPDEQGTP